MKGYIEGIFCHIYLYNLESYSLLFSNLIGMGIMPLQFVEGQSAESLGLTGKETFTIDIPQNLSPRQKTTVKVSLCFLFGLVVKVS